MSSARHAAPTRRRRQIHDGSAGRGSRWREWWYGLGALLLLLGFLVGVPALLIAVAGMPFSHGLPSWTRLSAQLRGPDDGELLKDVLLCLAWTGWGVFTLLTAIETVALARQTVAPTFVGLGSLQQAIGRLIAAVALLLPAASTALHLAGTAAPRIPATAPLRPAAPQPPQTLDGAATPFRPTLAATPRATATAATMTAEAFPVYVVGTDHTGARDTLWSIAQRHLGNPLRWREIAQLNNGRAQPDGSVFTDPNLIRPGWRLRLPADATGLPTQTPAPVGRRAEPPLSPVPAPQVAPPDPTEPRLPLSPSPSASSTPTSTPSPQTESEPVPSDSVPNPPAEEAQPRAGSVRLGPGSEISLALAAAILLGVSLRWLRRRQRYRPEPPGPAQLAGHPPLPPPLRQLLAHSDTTQELTGAPSGPQAHTSPPGHWKLGTRDNLPIELRWTDHPLLTFSGPGADSVVRALLVSALLDSSAGTDILAGGNILEVLLPGARPSAAVVQLDAPTDALRRLQLEVVSRSRLLADADLPTAAAYRARHPEDPFPALLLLADEALLAEPALHPLLAANSHLDIVAVALDDPKPSQPQEFSSIRVDDDGNVVSAQPATLDDQLAGARFFRLDPVDAVTLLHAVTDDEQLSTLPPLPTESIIDVDWTAAAPTPVPAAESTTPAEPVAEPTAAIRKPPVRVQLFGAVRIWVNDTEITTGLRRTGRELLAWYLLHPDGRTIEEAVDAIWPDDDPDRGRQHFWNALNSLRKRLRASAGETTLHILERSGDTYRPPRDEFDVDLWTFQAAVQTAGRASDPDTQLGALGRAIDSYTGPFAAGTDFLWAEPIREQCHRRALDAHVAQATLLAAAGNTEHAISTLENALELDPYAEELYRRLIELHHTAGRSESVRLLWQQLNSRLADIDSEPDDATYRLYRQCS